MTLRCARLSDWCGILVRRRRRGSSRIHPPILGEGNRCRPWGPHGPFGIMGPCWPMEVDVDLGVPWAIWDHGPMLANGGRCRPWGPGPLGSWAHVGDLGVPMGHLGSWAHVGQCGQFHFWAKMEMAGHCWKNGSRKGGRRCLALLGLSRTGAETKKLRSRGTLWCRTSLRRRCRTRGTLWCRSRGTLWCRLLCCSLGSWVAQGPCGIHMGLRSHRALPGSKGHAESIWA
jgi:hypothetical protein